jgi:hypothetical protein
MEVKKEAEMLNEKKAELRFDQGERMSLDEGEEGKGSEIGDFPLSDGSCGNSLLSEGVHMYGHTETWGSMAFQKILNLKSELPFEVIIAMVGIMPGVPRSVMASVNGIIVAYCQGISALSWRRVEYAIRSVGYSYMEKLKVCGCGRSLPCPDYKCNPAKTRPLFVLPLADQLKSILFAAPSELLLPRQLSNRSYPAWIEFLNVVEQSGRLYAVVIHITVSTTQTSYGYFALVFIPCAFTLCKFSYYVL